MEARWSPTLPESANGGGNRDVATTWRSTCRTLDPDSQVFQYLTFRGILGVLTALAISLLVGPYMIRRLNYHQIGQAVRATDRNRISARAARRPWAVR